MPLATLLLFTHTEFIDALWKYGPFGLVLGKWIYERFNGPSKEAELAAKKEREELKETLFKIGKRLDTVEETDRTAYPAFKTLCEDFRKLEEVVKNHHETRFTGIVGNIELFSKLYEAKLESASQRVVDLEKRLDKIDNKLDKIMEAVIENKRH